MGNILFLKGPSDTTGHLYESDLAAALTADGHTVTVSESAVDGLQVTSHLIFVSEYFTTDSTQRDLVASWFTSGIPVVLMGNNGLDDFSRYNLDQPVLTASAPNRYNSVNYDLYMQDTFDNDPDRTVGLSSSPIYPGTDIHYLRVVPKYSGGGSPCRLVQHTAASWRAFNFYSSSIDLYGVLGFTPESVGADSNLLTANLVWIANSRSSGDILASDGYKEVVVKSATWAMNANVLGSYGGNNTVCVEPTNDLTVTGKKQEYAIIGDAFFASVSVGETPEWIVNLINSTVGAAINIVDIDIQEIKWNIHNALAQLDVAKNAYEELINIEITIDSVIATRLATLNASIANAEAQIIELWTASATQDWATAMMVNQISASVNNGTIRSAFTSIEIAMAGITDDLDAKYIELYDLNESMEVAIGIRIDTLEAAITNGTNALIEETWLAIAAETFARTEAVTLLRSELTDGGSFSSISQRFSTMNTAIGANATATTNLTSTLRGSYANVSEYRAAMITADTDNASAIASIGARYGVRLTATGIAPGGGAGAQLVGGFELLNDGTDVSAGFDVDTFWVGRASVTGGYPFTVVGGVVYINTAMIQNATISFAKITNDIQSTNFVTTTAGFKIDAVTGAAEFSDIYARGNIEATSISASAVDIVDTLNVAGRAVTATQIAVGGGPVIHPDNNAWNSLISTELTPITIKAGMQGIIIIGHIQLRSDDPPDIAIGNVQIFRNATTTGAITGTGYNIDGNLGSYAMIGFDATPGTVGDTVFYTMRIKNEPSGASGFGTDVASWSPSIILTAGYR